MKIVTWALSHKALIASLVYAGALAISGQTVVAAGLAIAALSGGVKPIPTP